MIMLSKTIDSYKLPREYDKRVKLTEDEVCEIKQLYSEGLLTQHEIASMFYVSQSCICYIVNPKALSKCKANRQKCKPRKKEIAKLYARDLRQRKRALLFPDSVIV